MSNMQPLPSRRSGAVQALLQLELRLAPSILYWGTSGTSVFPYEAGAHKSLSAQAVMRTTR